ncbi:MAG: hypothetical protein ACOYK7_07280 [Pirellulales bacterium]
MPFSAQFSPTGDDRMASEPAALEAHLARRRYGRFTLTEAIRPGWPLEVVPRAGYRHDSFVDSQANRLPALVAAVTSENLFDTFLDLLQPIGDVCDVILETAHDRPRGDHVDLVRHGIERTVLESVLWDFDDVLLDDGCTGIAVMHPQLPLEVQFDAHKLLVVYAPETAPFERILRARGVPADQSIRFLFQAEHVHASHSRLARRFEELANRLAAE